MPPPDAKPSCVLGHGDAAFLLAPREFLKFVNGYFGTVFLFSDPVFLLEQLAGRSDEQELLLSYDRTTVLQLGHVTRAELIKKWISLGRELVYEEEETEREISEVDHVLTSLVGKNTLPRLPFVIISLLEAYVPQPGSQTQENRRPETAA